MGDTLVRASLLFDYDDEGPTLEVANRGVHAAHRLEPMLFDLPLCWVHEGVGRGAQPEHWEVADDHATLPAVWMVPVPANKAAVTCRDCLELVHA